MKYSQALPFSTTCNIYAPTATDANNDGIDEIVRAETTDVPCKLSDLKNNEYERLHQYWLWFITRQLYLPPEADIQPSYEVYVDDRRFRVLSIYNVRGSMSPIHHIKVYITSVE